MFVSYVLKHREKGKGKEKEKKKKQTEGLNVSNFALLLVVVK